MFVKDWMTTSPQTVRETDSVTAAWERLHERGIHQLPVVDESARLVGMITDRDIRSAIGFEQKLGDSLEVSEVMTSDPETLPSDATLDHAVALFCANSFNALPVMNRKELAGIITRFDMLRAFRFVMGLDMAGSRVEVALPDIRADLRHAFEALESYDGRILSAIVSQIRRDGDEPTLYLRVSDQTSGNIERQLRDAGLVVLLPETS